MFRGTRPQWQRFASSSIHHFWDTPQHFLKTHFCWQSGFLVFLEIQKKSLLVSFQGYWTQWQRFESSSFHYFWNTSQHFLKTHFCLESGFLSFLELHKSLLVIFTGVLNYNGKGLKVLAFTISEIPHSIFSKHIYDDKVAFLSFLELQKKSLLLSVQGYWTQWQRFASSSIHHFWDTPQHFLKTHFCWQSGFLVIPRAPQKIPTSKFSGVLEHNGKGLQALAFTISEIPHSIFSKHIFA